VQSRRFKLKPEAGQKCSTAGVGATGEVKLATPDYRVEIIVTAALY